MKVNNFRDLAVWQRSLDIAHTIRQSTLAFPKHETFGLASQIQRAAVSIPSNIAEGHERDSTKEYLYHLSLLKARARNWKLSSNLHKCLDILRMKPLSDSSPSLAKLEK
jgi:four helix bundle protein